MSDKGVYEFFDHHPAPEDMAAAVLAGLRNEPKKIEPKYFYDARGSELFEQITRLDEYYLTRTELSLFDAHLRDIAGIVGRNVCLIEYGSGTSLKIRKLLEAVSPRAYVPVDISSEHLQDNARTLHQDYPWLNVYPVCADFSRPVPLPDAVADLEKVAFFPGSSIGNFDPQQAHVFLENVRATVGPGGVMLVGVDRKKDVQVLEQAYDDAQGVTAAFNLNALQHLNDTLGANFALDQFRHVARYNQTLGCIQMFLQSLTDQCVTVAGVQVAFASGELLHTENSFKYHPEEFVALARSAGFEVDHQYTDERAWFGLYLLRGC